MTSETCQPVFSNLKTDSGSKDENCLAVKSSITTEIIQSTSENCGFTSSQNIAELDSGSRVNDPEDFDVVESEIKAAVEDGNQLLEKGHGLLLAGKYEDAVNAYSEALESLTYAYGEVAWECAHPYYFYGRGLWLLASQEGSNVFGESIQKAADIQPKEELVFNTTTHQFSGDGDEMDDPLKNDVKGKKPAVKNETHERLVNERGKKTDDQSSKMHGNGPNLHENIDKISENEEDEEDGEDGEDGEGEDDEYEEEKENAPMDNLELAWQALDTARLIFDRHQHEQGAKQKLAQTHMLLGDISMENDNFTEAASDYECGLAIKRSLLAPHDRELAEILYKLVMALEQDCQYVPAVQRLSEAMDVLHLRTRYIQTQLLGEDQNTESLRNELEDIQSLFPELEAKLEELRKPEEKISLPQLLMESLKGQVPVAAGFAGSTSDSADHKVVNDLTNFVRKKSNLTEESKRKLDSSDSPDKRTKGQE